MAVRKGGTVRDDAAAREELAREELAWTPEELDEVREELLARHDELQEEYRQSMESLMEFQRTALGEGGGDDSADVGSKTLEREQELALANNNRDLLRQVEHALDRLAGGTYGTCESCGQPIPKARLQAFPSATLCVTCRQREERR